MSSWTNMLNITKLKLLHSLVVALELLCMCVAVEEFSCRTDRYLVGMFGPNSLPLCSPHLQWYRALVQTAHLEVT